LSFTAELILETLPLDEKSAWRAIENLREEYYEDETGANPKLKELHDILIQKYPCLCSYADDDPEMENSPWADGPLIGNFASKMGMVSIRFSSAYEVFPFVLKSALALGITVADGQSEKIYRPGETATLESKPWWKLW